MRNATQDNCPLAVTWNEAPGLKYPTPVNGPFKKDETRKIALGLFTAHPIAAYRGLVPEASRTSEVRAGSPMEYRVAGMTRF